MIITKGLEVKIKREMMDSNGLILPKDTLLKINAGCYEFESVLYELTGEIIVDGVKEEVKLWAYTNDFTLTGILVN